jgi:hypothetical protein
MFQDSTGLHVPKARLSWAASQAKATTSGYSILNPALQNFSLYLLKENCWIAGFKMG